jgi:hypothetical protein
MITDPNLTLHDRGDYVCWERHDKLDSMVFFFSDCPHMCYAGFDGLCCLCHKKQLDPRAIPCSLCKEHLWPSRRR